MTVTVAIPTLNGVTTLEPVLAGVRSQRLPTAEIELLVCDSGSHDGTLELVRRYDATVLEIEPGSFSHGATRNLLMERARGDHVAFLTQDSVPADTEWLARLLRGFTVAPDVALVFGPYLPRVDASPMVTRELTAWFASFSAGGAPRIDRLEPSERNLPSRALLGPRGFFTDANGALARDAWQTVPFRTVPYAEDHLLAHDVMRAGYAKVFMPDAAVIHSHDYAGIDWLRRSFDEFRGLHDVYGFAVPLGPRRNGLNVWGLVGADWRWTRTEARGRAPLTLLPRSLWHHSLRTAGALLGGRADRLPDSAVRRLSLERRGHTPNREDRRDRGLRPDGD